MARGPIKTTVEKIEETKKLLSQAEAQVIKIKKELKALEEKKYQEDLASFEKLLKEKNISIEEVISSIKNK